MSANSHVIGHVYDAATPTGPCTWEVWTDGKAYSSTATGPQVAYRWPDGTWREDLARSGSAELSVSKQLEEVFSVWMNELMLGPRAKKMVLV